MPDDPVVTIGADAGGAVSALAEVNDALTRFNAGLAETGRAAGRIARPFRRAFDEIGGGIRAALAGVLSGTETLRRAEARLARSLALGGVGIAESAVSEAAAGPLARLLGGNAAPGQGVGDVLGNALGRWLFGMPQQLSQAAAVTANTAALVANTSAVAALSAALGASAVTTGAGAAAAGGAAHLGASAAGGGLFGWLGGLLGFSRGGVVPSAAGGWALPNFAGATPALLHAREMVLPADISQGLQQMIGTGGGPGADMHFHAHFHGPADAPAIGRWFRDNLHRNAGALRDLFRSNALTPRSF